MRPPKLRTTPLVQQLAAMQQATEANMKFAGLPRGTVRGTIKDVNDPENRGRVRVVFDDMNPEIPQVSGAGDWSKERVGEEPDLSHWIDVSPAFNGKQPKGMVGKRVNISVSNGQYQYAVLQDVMYDPQLLATGKQGDLKRPNNSSMTRLPVYDVDEVPLPSEDNHGCLIIENNGPMNGDWICVCVKRDGKFYWVRLADLAHGHAGGNDGSQQVDSMGNRQNPVMQGATGDGVFPTTHQQMTLNSNYTTNPQGNPKGKEAHWYPAPQSGDEFKPGENKPLLNPVPDGALSFVRDPAGFSSLTQSFGSYVPSFNPSISSILSADAKKSLEKAQQVAKLLQKTQEVLSNPTQFVIDQALAGAAGLNPEGTPPGTSVALGDLQNPQGTLNTTLPSPPTSLPSGIGAVFKQVRSFFFGK